jgi:outer membrane beta-barrel protein
MSGWKKAACALSVALMAVGVGSAAQAQEPPATTENAPAAAAPAAATPAAAEAPAASGSNGDTQVYWGDKRNVSIVQKRIFTKDGRLELSAFVGLIPNDPFRIYAPVGARLNYYFLESISLEVDAQFTDLQVESGLKDTLKNKNSAEVTLLDNQKWRAGAGVAWSPFYGKLSMFDTRLSHFDINLLGGFGVLQTVSASIDRTSEQSEIKPEGILGVGFRFFLTQSFTLRADYRQYIFQKVGGGTATPSEVSLGASFFFGGE